MDLTAIVSAVIALLAAVVTTVLVPWLKGKLSQQEVTQLLEWVDIVVTAAQQLYHTQPGARRKEYVLEFLKSKGYDVNTKEVDNAIEAAVLRLHQQLEAA